jgi:hypothetical protein
MEFSHNPEYGPEQGDSEFDSLLAEMGQLAAGSSASDFIFGAFEEAGRRGLPLNDGQVERIAQYGFGPVEAARQTVADLSEEDLAQRYPGPVGELLKWYIETREQK